MKSMFTNIKNEQELAEEVDIREFNNKIATYYNETDIGKLVKLIKSDFSRDCLETLLNETGYNSCRHDFYYLIIKSFPEMFNKSFTKKFRQQIKKEGITKF